VRQGEPLMEPEKRLILLDLSRTDKLRLHAEKLNLQPIDYMVFIIFVVQGFNR